MARRGDDAGAAQKHAERVLSVHRSLFAHHSGHFGKSSQPSGDQRDQNRFPKRIAPQLADIENLEFMSPALYFVLMPELWKDNDVSREKMKFQRLPQTNRYDTAFIKK